MYQHTLLKYLFAESAIFSSSFFSCINPGINLHNGGYYMQLGYCSHVSIILQKRKCFTVCFIIKYQKHTSVLIFFGKMSWDVLYCCDVPLRGQQAPFLFYPHIQVYNVHINIFVSCILKVLQKLETDFKFSCCSTLHVVCPRTNSKLYNGYIVTNRRMVVILGLQ